ncbi:MAG: hypothetical protein M0P61_15195 [Ignavibacteriaceae bacterium]|nr:hypothetical protein [Ignavibacteriaceae bacterium]
MKTFTTLLLFLCLFPAAIRAQEKITTSFESSDGKIVITYELTGDINQEYNVQIKLKRKSSPYFDMVPTALSGDFGLGKYAGGRRNVIWTLNQTEINQLEGDDFYFEIIATKIKSSSTWYYYVGAVLAGGGVAAALLLKKSASSTPASQNISLPPERP